MLLETSSTDGRLALEVRLELALVWLEDVESGTTEYEPVEIPATSALARRHIRCSVLEFAAAEADEVNRVGVCRQLVDRIVRGRFRFRHRHRCEQWFAVGRWFGSRSGQLKE